MIDQVLPPRVLVIPVLLTRQVQLSGSLTRAQTRYLMLTGLEIDLVVLRLCIVLCLPDYSDFPLGLLLAFQVGQTFTLLTDRRIVVVYLRLKATLRQLS